MDGQPRGSFPTRAATRRLGIDLDMKPGTRVWRVGVVEPGREPWSAQGKLTIAKRDFPVERLTLPKTMVDLDPETERRAVAESKQLAALYRTITPERFWRGKFTKPVGTPAPGTGSARAGSSRSARLAPRRHRLLRRRAGRRWSRRTPGGLPSSPSSSFRVGW